MKAATVNLQALQSLGTLLEVLAFALEHQTGPGPIRMPELKHLVSKLARDLADRLDAEAYL